MIESIYQSKSESPLIADKGDAEGACYFLRSRYLQRRARLMGRKLKH